VNHSGEPGGDITRSRAKNAPPTRGITCTQTWFSYRVVEVPVTKVYPPRHLGQTKMHLVFDWWSILRPLVCAAYPAFRLSAMATWDMRELYH
jgi:hypothetical protein